MVDIDYTPKTKPLPHQIEAIDSIEKNSIIALFDEQGLGKSKIVIDALSKNLSVSAIDSVLIVCKKSLIQTWKNEIIKHSKLRVVVIHGSSLKKRYSYIHFSHFYITTYETISTEIDILIPFMKAKRFAIVLDESHRIKNPDSKAAITLNKIKNYSVKRIIITGTPIANKPDDLWSQFYFLDNGKTFGENYFEFRKEYSLDLKKELKQADIESKLLTLKNKINRVSIRRTKNILELPEKIFIEEFVELPGKQEHLYNKLKDELKLELKDYKGDVFYKNIDNILEKLLRLTQITSNPRLIFPEFNEEPIKYLKLDELVEACVNKDEKIIIWSSFIKNIRDLKARYSQFGSLMIYGDIPIIERNKSVEKFQNNPKNQILIANPSAAKEGLTLTAANNAIYLDRNFKMDDYIQSQDRIHRIGQEKKCNIIKIIAKNTIDEYIDDILQKKEIISKFTLGDTETIELENRLTREDIFNILG